MPGTSTNLSIRTFWYIKRIKTSRAVTRVMFYQRAFPLLGRAARLPLSAQGCSLPAAHLSNCQLTWKVRLWPFSHLRGNDNTHSSWYPWDPGWHGLTQNGVMGVLGVLRITCRHPTGPTEEELLFHLLRTPQVQGVLQKRKCTSKTVSSLASVAEATPFLSLHYLFIQSKLTRSSYQYLKNTRSISTQAVMFNPNSWLKGSVKHWVWICETKTSIYMHKTKFLGKSQTFRSKWKEQRD